MAGRRGISTVVASVAAALLCLVPASAGAATVVNGDFEQGSLNGWTTDTTGAPAMNNWFAYTGASSPITGTPITAPPQGSFAAVTEQSGPGRQTMYQDVALEAESRHTLSLFVYYQTVAAIASPESLDPTNPPPNQQYRIDVVRPEASLTSLSPDDILLTVFRTVTGDPSTLAPTEITANLTPFAGRTVRLRFTEVDNQAPFYASTDAVAIESVDATIPETTITKRPKDKVKTKRKRAKATFEFTSNEPGTSFECSVDNQPFAACASPFTTKVTKGRHNFAVRAKDAAGNVDGSSATDDWKVKRKKKK